MKLNLIYKAPVGFYYPLVENDFGYADVPVGGEPVKVDSDRVETPDDYYDTGEEGIVAFIFTDKLLVGETYDTTHMEIVSDNPREFDFEFDDFDEDDEEGEFDDYDDYSDAYDYALNDYRHTLEDKVLLGRVSGDRMNVAFWNSSDQLHGNLNKCLMALLRGDLISQDTMVHVQGVRAVSTSDVISNTRKDVQAQMDTRQVELARKRRELHVMGAREKKAAMRDLGMVGAQKERRGQPGVKWWAPQSEAVQEDWADAETYEQPVQSSPRSLSPDNYYKKPGNVTFIYKKGELIYSDKPHTSHVKLMIRNPDIFGEFSDSDELLHFRRELESVALTGRVSPNRSNVVFWNTVETLNGQLEFCLKDLLSRGFITKDTIVHIQAAAPMSTSEVLSTNGDTRRDVQAKVDTRGDEESRKRKELHMMDAGAKKKTMKDLGMVGAQKKAPGQPGVKWWAPQSEAVQD